MFTQYQVTELKHLISTRRETIEDDPLSASECEDSDFLLELWYKVGTTATQYTTREKEWLLEELNDHLDKCESPAQIRGAILKVINAENSAEAEERRTYLKNVSEMIGDNIQINESKTK